MRAKTVGQLKRILADLPNELALDRVIAFEERWVPDTNRPALTAPDEVKVDGRKRTRTRSQAVHDVQVLAVITDPKGDDQDERGDKKDKDRSDRPGNR